MEFRLNQRGSTILGFIAGLITGLVIAIVVAAVVTKMSVPVGKKQISQGKVAEPSAAQMADPNKPLQGNNAAAKEAAKSFAKEDGPKTDKPGDGKASLQAKAGKDEPKKDLRKEVKPDGKGATDKKKVDEGWTYYLQTHAYRDAADAESARARLALSGFEARIAETTSQGAPLYRVRLGPFSQIDTMNRVRAKLTEGGIDAAVIRVPK